MSIKVVLFDLDGTLLPMDQDIFVKTYFKGIATKLAPQGYDPRALIDAIWMGTSAMIKNDGHKSNESVFWDVFAGIFGEKARGDELYFEEFYKTDFPKIQSVCGFSSKAAEIVYKLKENGIRVALATNPIFPSIATETRIRWAGLEPKDFEFYTTYENSNYSKPNLEYYKKLTVQLGVEPEECLMVGNDVDDDMVVTQLGMKAFLLTDCLINKYNVDISAFDNGDFSQLDAYIECIMAQNKRVCRQ